MKTSKVIIATAAIIASSITLSSCANMPNQGNYGSSYRPIVDSIHDPKFNYALYESNLSECQQYSTQVLGAGDRALLGAVVGALLGAAIGHSSNNGNELAAFGAITGGLQGAVDGSLSQQQIISRCLAGRGYSVLN